MALIQTVSVNDLVHLASKGGRLEQFKYKGWRAIGDYLESLSDDLGEDVEIDIIGICCEYSCAESVKEFYMEFSYEHGIDLPTMEEWEEMSEEEKLETIEEFLQNSTSVVVCKDDLIIWKAF